MKQHYHLLLSNQNMVDTERAGLGLTQPSIALTLKGWIGSHPALKVWVKTSPLYPNPSLVAKQQVIGLFQTIWI